MEYGVTQSFTFKWYYNRQEAQITIKIVYILLISKMKSLICSFKLKLQHDKFKNIFYCACVTHKTTAEVLM